MNGTATRNVDSLFREHCASLKNEQKARKSQAIAHQVEHLCPIIDGEKSVRENYCAIRDALLERPWAEGLTIFAAGFAILSARNGDLRTVASAARHALALSAAGETSCGWVRVAATGTEMGLEDVAHFDPEWVEMYNDAYRKAGDMQMSLLS